MIKPTPEPTDGKFIADDSICSSFMAYVTAFVLAFFALALGFSVGLLLE